MKKICLNVSSKKDFISLTIVIRFRRLRVINISYDKFDVNNKNEDNESSSLTQLYYRVKTQVIFVNKAQKIKRNNINFVKKSIRKLHFEKLSEKI